MPEILANFVALPARHLWIALAVTIGFTAVARRLHGVSRSGAAVGAVVCFVLFASAGTGALITLISVFVLTWLTTRWGYAQKQKLGTAERRDGRKASQVLANLGVATVCAAAFMFNRGPEFLLAMAAALAEAAADTVSSEAGQARSSQARLVTTWERVAAGTNGGVSLVGTSAGIAAALLVSLIAAVSHLIGWKGLAVSVPAATVGMLTDSFLGALLEGRGFLNNDAVNFLGTLSAAGFTFLLSF
jgi:uncharacterized protein (TIGR00297 family)